MAVHTGKRNRGFTLIELIVVLMILVGLAAVLIPAVSDMVTRTNASTFTANIAEVANSVQRYESLYLSYPDNLDSLKSDLTGTDLTTLNAGLTALLADVTLTAPTLAPLNNAGISTIGVHGATDATFDLPTATTITATTLLNGLTPAAQVSLGLETTGVAGKYVVFGIGARSEMNGTTNLDAPVYFPENGSLNPRTIYGRFIVVFQITDGTNPLARAKFVSVVTPTGLSLADGISKYFDVTTES